MQMRPLQQDVCIDIFGHAPTVYDIMVTCPSCDLTMSTAGGGILVRRLTGGGAYDPIAQKLGISTDFTDGACAPPAATSSEDECYQ